MSITSQNLIQVENVEVGQPVVKIDGKWVVVAGASTDINGEAYMKIITDSGTTFKFQPNTVVKHIVKEGETLTVDSSGMTNDTCATMELWLTMETLVSFTLTGVEWFEPPTFELANMVYTIVLRWDGAKVLAQSAYFTEVD